MRERVYDISVPLSSTLPVWPGDPPFDLNRLCDFSNGDSVCVSLICLSLHAGTHIDAPLHFFAGGKGIGDFPPQRFFGSCRVIEISDGEKILPEALPSPLPPFVLLKTANSEKINRRDPPVRDFVYVTETAAQKLITEQVGLVGIDYYSIEPDGKDAVHRLLLSNEVLILETIDLTEAPAGYYDLYCFPIMIENAEAAPVRAILIPKENE